MLIAFAVLLVVAIYGSYRTFEEKGPIFFRRFWSLGVHTFFKADKKVTIILWMTVAASLSGTMLLGPRRFNTSNFDIPMHLLFGFLATELIRNANDYWPFVDRVRGRSPARLAPFVAPATFALALSVAHTVAEEIQDMIPSLQASMYTDLSDVVKDTVMDGLGVALSAKRASIRRKQAD